MQATSSGNGQALGDMGPGPAWDQLYNNRYLSTAGTPSGVKCYSNFYGDNAASHLVNNLATSFSQATLLQRFLGDSWRAQLEPDWKARVLAFQSKSHDVSVKTLSALALALSQDKNEFVKVTLHQFSSSSASVTLCHCCCSAAHVSALQHMQKHLTFTAVQA